VSSQSTQQQLHHPSTRRHAANTVVSPLTCTVHQTTCNKACARLIGGVAHVHCAANSTAFRPSAQRNISFTTSPSLGAHRTFRMAGLMTLAAPRPAQPQLRLQSRPRAVRVSAKSDPDGNAPPPPPAAAADTQQTPNRTQLPPNPISNPAGVVAYGGRLPPARRLIVSGLTATAVGKPD
jgi:hypothetical protein